MVLRFFSQVVLSLFLLACFDVSALAPESFRSALGGDALSSLNGLADSSVEEGYGYRYRHLEEDATSQHFEVEGREGDGLLLVLIGIVL